ncbi:MAG: hypothetical protein QY320_06155 [Gammaproteobacteria bacterium]|nr:MAG: hypothetical protein QY320_06155 [Gammaproteobacteria bacterium]
MEHAERHRTTDKLTQAAHETVDRVAERAARAEEQVRDAADRAAERARVAREKTAAEADATVRKVTGYIQENPLTSAAIAFAAGAVLSALLRR